MGRVAFKVYDCFLEDYLVVLPLMNNNRKETLSCCSWEGSSL